ncbi:hypothetical protein QBC41DRAFT_298972 [Cercophora samala]|uniref:Uncharacterized protein n=1 Tax=Cercophora samala TaxID=330535 RepID=A0AA40DG82_9PEZI|nr:hypothetical protein QBC41DRAFT_298972 [Cercophora samala]
MIHDDEDIVDNPFVRGPAAGASETQEFNLDAHSWEPVAWNRRNAKRIRCQSLERKGLLETVAKIEALPSRLPESSAEKSTLGQEMVFLAIKNTVFLLRMNGYTQGVPLKHQAIKAMESLGKSRCAAHLAGDEVLGVYYEVSLLVAPVIFDLETEEVERLVRQVDTQELGKPLPRMDTEEGNLWFSNSARNLTALHELMGTMGDL